MKKALSFLLCLVMLTAPLAGHATTTDPAATTNPIDTIDWTNHETFTAWLFSTPNDYYSSYSDNPVVQYLNKKFNITLEYEQPATGTEQETMSLMFGTGEYTDFIDINSYTGSIQELYEDGIIINLAEYLDYMPNYKTLLEEHEVWRKAAYTDDGLMLVMKCINVQDELAWGGLVYRKDILSTMTGGSIAFPSGNNEPTTIEDWDYMLPLFKAYFEAAGMTDYAPLILPSTGYFYFNELINGFGANFTYYLQDDVVTFGAIENGFYNYLLMMREWYAAGYIYKDFASRTGDPFYLPNTALTYGGAAGAWYGLTSQLGPNMSMPQYGLNYDVQPAASPLDTQHSITNAYPIGYMAPVNQPGGFVVTTACKNIPKLLAVLDSMYTVEGGLMRTAGLSSEYGSADDAVYQMAGITEGTFEFVDGKFVKNPKMSDGSVDKDALLGLRLPGFADYGYNNLSASEDALNAHYQWRTRYADAQGMMRLPGSLSYSAAEENKLKTNNTQITDYINENVPKFIMGTQELNETTWAAFVEQIKAYGLEDNIQIMQDAYARYLKR